MFARPWIVVPSLMFFCGLFIWFLWAQAKAPSAGPRASDAGSIDSPKESRAGAADSPKGSQAGPEYFTGPFQETVVVPTLDTPMPKGKNVIWCGTFAMAWGELSAKVVKEPIRLKDADEICGRLNAAAQMDLRLPEGSFYVRAGPSVETIPIIKREMAERFPKADYVSLPENPQPFEYISLAYLIAHVQFTKPFLPDKLHWLGGEDDQAVKIQAFGIPEDQPCKELRPQVEVLGAAGEAHFADRYAVDPCKDSSPNQIVLAVLPRNGSLAEMLQGLGQLTGQKVMGGTELYGGERLLIPAIAFRIDRRFSEVENRLLLNKGFESFFINTALQRVAFKLDRCGATVEASAMLGAAKDESIRNLVFNRPFLVVMRRRGVEQPFFVMWVENAELLQKL